MNPSALPVYRHIAATLTARLDSGEFPPGSRLPAVRALAAEFGVNTLTALAAYRYLEQQQRVLARPRAGYFAALPAAPSLPGTAAPLPSAAAMVDVSSRMSTCCSWATSAFITQLHSRPPPAVSGR
jgi:DNA-binding transcriptional regulator YhcF (GntR family)